MQAQKLDNALLSLLGTSRDPRTDRPVYLTDVIRVEVEFRGLPTAEDRRMVARLGSVARRERADVLTLVAPATALAPLSELPQVAKLHYAGLREAS